MIVKNNYNECITNLACSIRKYFDLDYSQSTDESLQGYIDYLQKNDDELPKGFYQKRSLIGGI